MRVVLRIFLFGIVSSSPLLSQSSDLLREYFDQAGAQAEINRCSAEEAHRVEAEMDAVYQELLAAVRDQPDATKKIKVEQKAWLAYRDAYLDAMFPAEDKQAEYGTLFVSDFDLAMADLMRQRVTALKALLERHSPSR